MTNNNQQVTKTLPAQTKLALRWSPKTRKMFRLYREELATAQLTIGEKDPLRLVGRQGAWRCAAHATG